LCGAIKRCVPRRPMQAVGDAVWAWADSAAASEAAQDEAALALAAAARRRLAEPRAQALPALPVLARSCPSDAALELIAAVHSQRAPPDLASRHNSREDVCFCAATTSRCGRSSVAVEAGMRALPAHARHMSAACLAAWSLATKDLDMQAAARAGATPQSAARC